MPQCFSVGSMLDEVQGFMCILLAFFNQVNTSQKMLEGRHVFPKYNI